MVMVRCPSCQKNLNVPDKYAGKKGKCPACQGVLLIPAASGIIPDTVPAPPKMRKPAAPAPVEEELVEEADEAEEEERIAPQPVKRGKPRPAVVEEVDEAEAEDAEEEAIVTKPAKKRRPVVEEEDDDDRPRPKKRKKPRGEWAECPKCGAADATRVRWTFWGGMIGPMLINTVRCNDCGTQYNGNHGDYNTVRILIYVLVTLALAAAIGGVAIFVELMGH